MRTIVWSVESVKDMDGLQRNMRERILSALHRLAINGAGDVKQLRGMSGEYYRLRVGEYRVIFRRNPTAGTVIILRVRARGGAYR